MPKTQKIRIFCASPTDVTAERKALREVINELNLVYDNRGLTLSFLGWEKNTRPQQGRPQQRVLDQIPPETWDVFVGVLWKRFGQPTGADKPDGAPFESGLEEEFVAALDQFEKTGRPEIMMYRCTRPPEDFFQPDVLKHLQKVNDFFAKFKAGGDYEGLYREYNTAQDFKDAVRIDLQKLIDEMREKDRDAAPKTPSAKPAVDLARVRRRYLKKLQAACDRLPLSAIAEERDPQKNARLSLGDVYVDLNTTDRVDKDGKPILSEKMRVDERSGEDKTLPLAVLTAAAQNDHLVILGDPGAGKSSFINRLLSGLAAKQWGGESAMLEKWPHAHCFPVRALVRELVVALEKSRPESGKKEGALQRQKRLNEIVFQHLAAKLKEDYDAEDFAPALREEIADGHCLIVFDGLDEAPTVPRVLAREAIEAFCAENPGSRVIVTCRVRSYEGQTRLAACKHVTLAPFDDGQIERFIQRWYDALIHVDHFTLEKGEEKKASLRNAVGHMDKTLVQNPLLLTTMAVIHANNVELPKQRVKLYKKASDLLLLRWQEEKAGKITLFEEIGLKDENKLHQALWELGWRAQQADRDSGSAQGADLPEDEAVKILKRNFSGVEFPLTAAEKFLDFVDHSAGLLSGRGGGESRTYGFPHRTFQEYFAGCFLAKRTRDFKRELVNLLPEGDYWRLTAQLGVEELLHNMQTEFPAIDAACHLCPETVPPPEDENGWRGVFWAACFANEIGKNVILQDRGGPAFIDRLTKRLVTLLETSRLPARERAEAGLQLGRLGDPRPGVCTLEPQWIDIPGGEFVMGDNTITGLYDASPEHRVRVLPFKISKYLVTNAQFASFIQAGGYRERRWWSEGGWQFCKKKELSEPHWWNDSAWNAPNQPVVGVSWFEAEAFCNWLTEKLDLPKGVTVRLPTEAEGEYAARDGEGRIYPWGDEKPDMERANYDETGLERTSAVGIFPRGVTPEKVCDLAGNVWEWRLDWYAKYETSSAVIENPTGPKTGELRVLRGGSWSNYPYDLRCADRYGYVPTLRYVNVGFRCSQDVP